MPKPKQFLKDNKKKSKAQQLPETADEYLAVGVEFEEAGEKWRAGDAAKSTRFFIRAIDTYEEALRKFPTTFDLSYNKARVQYELTQHPKLAAQLPGTLIDLLKVALDSSRAALNLRQDDADALFNTAQVLTSLVEALQADRSSSVGKDNAYRLLEEAIELFQRCLTLQEYQFSESQAQQDAMTTSDSDEIPDTEDGGVSISEDTDTQPSEAQDERWASIVEPVTNDTLLETVLAQLETLTDLCSYITGDEGRGLAWIEEYATGLLTQKLPTYVQGTDREEEAALTRANFLAALAEANFQSHQIDAATYQRGLEEAYGKLDLSSDPEGLCEKAEALIAYNSALRTQQDGSDPNNPNQKAATTSRWSALSTALDSLTAASKLPSADNLAKIHLSRGDCELLRFQLGLTPTLYPAAAKNAPTLLKNAGTFYRGAEAHAVAAKGDKEVKEAVVKQALVGALAGEGEKLMELVKVETEAAQVVLEEAVDDGLITIDWLVKAGIMH